MVGPAAKADGREAADEDVADDARFSVIAEHLQVVLVRSDGPLLKVGTRTLGGVFFHQIGGSLLLRVFAYTDRLTDGHQRRRGGVHNNAQATELGDGLE